MKCPKCKKEIPDTALFCTQCGHKLGPRVESREDIQEEKKENVKEAVKEAEGAFSDYNFAPSPFDNSDQAYENPYRSTNSYSEDPAPEWDPYSQILRKAEQPEDQKKEEPEEEEHQEEKPSEEEAYEEEASENRTSEEGNGDLEDPEKTDAVRISVNMADDSSKDSKVEEEIPQKKKGRFWFIPAVAIVALAVYIGYQQGALRGKTGESGASTADVQIEETSEEGMDESIHEEEQDAEAVVEPPEPSPEPEVTESLFNITIEQELNMETEPGDEEMTEPSAALESVASLVDKQSVSIDSSKQIGIFSAEATSTIVQETTTNEPMLMFDNKLDTNWQEGVEGAGIGQGFTAVFQEPSRVKYMVFYLGNWKSDNYFYGNNRPKVLSLELGELHTQIEFPDKWEEFYVELAPACEASSLTVTIDAVYAGNSWDDTVIADIRLYRE